MKQFITTYEGFKQQFQGWIPLAHDTAARDEILDSAAPWDETSQPEIVDWKSLRPYVEQKAKERDAQREVGICHWPWMIAKHFGIPYVDPFQRTTDCAGFAAIAATEETVLQQMADGARLSWFKYNPSPTWMMGRRDANYGGGGATLGMMLSSLNKYGGFPISVAGEYDANYRKGSAYWDAMKSEGEKFQASVCYLGNLNRQEMFDATILCSRAGLKVEIGSDRKMGNVTYKNGLKEAVDGGSTAHATTFTAWREIQGVQYLFEKGSWGKYYKNNASQERENTPECGAWVSQDFVWKRTGTRFADFFVVIYAESLASKSDWNLSIPSITFPLA